MSQRRPHTRHDAVHATIALWAATFLYSCQYYITVTHEDDYCKYQKDSKPDFILLHLLDGTSCPTASLLAYLRTSTDTNRDLLYGDTWFTDRKKSWTWSTFIPLELDPLGGEGYCCAYFSMLNKRVHAELYWSLRRGNLNLWLT